MPRDLSSLGPVLNSASCHVQLARTTSIALWMSMEDGLHVQKWMASLVHKKGRPSLDISAYLPGPFARTYWDDLGCIDALDA